MQYHSAPNTPKGISPTLSSMPEADTEREVMSQSLMESLSAQSNSEAETIKNSKSSDIENQPQSDGQENVPTLIQMYKQKYPESAFDAFAAEMQQPLIGSVDLRAEKASDSGSILGSQSNTLDEVPETQPAGGSSSSLKRSPSLAQGESNPQTVLKALEEVNTAIHSKLQADTSSNKSQDFEQKKEEEVCKLADSANDQEKVEFPQSNQENMNPRSLADPSDTSKFYSAAFPNDSPGLNSMSTYGGASRSSSGNIRLLLNPCFCLTVFYMICRISSPVHLCGTHIP